MPEKFENAALFLGLSLLYTLVRHENASFRTSSSIQGKLKTLVLQTQMQNDWRLLRF